MNDIKGNIGDSFYFGKSGNLIENKVDYEISGMEKEGRAFCVYFNLEKEKYYIDPTGSISHLYMKLQVKAPIIKQLIVSFGMYNFHATIQPNKALNLKIFNDEIEIVNSTFSPKKGKIIRIGRAKDNEIVIKDNSVSRVHCT